VQPVGSTNLPGETVTLSVVADANGYPPVSYRWRRNGLNLVNGGNLAGVTTDTLTLSGITGGDTGSYTVIVSNSVAGLSSVPAYLQVIVAPGVRISSRSGGQLITPTISAFSSEHVGFGRYASNLVNGAGISGPGYYTDTHVAAAIGWARDPSDPNPSVTFDLGTNCNLLTTRIWNYNSPNFAGDGAKDIRVSVSFDNTNFTILGTNTLVIAGGTPYEPAQDFATAAADIRYVRLEPLSGYGAETRALGAVRFVVDSPQRPALVKVAIDGVPGLHYQVEYRDDLGGAGVWQTLDIPALPGTPYDLPILDGLVPTNAPQRFYRAGVVWP